jgi:PAS domain S-box-containing protein
VPATKKDGTRISIEFTLGLMKDSGGKVEAVVAVLRDVTEHFNRDREMRQKLAEMGKAQRPS